MRSSARAPSHVPAVESEIQVTDVEPGRRAELRQGITGPEGLAEAPPARLGIPQASERVEDGIHVRADAHAEPCEVIARIGDNAQVAGGDGLTQGGDQPGSAQAAGKENDPREHHVYRRQRGSAGPGGRRAPSRW